MDLPSLSNGSSATVELVPQVGPDGRQLAIVLIKELFSIAEDNRLARTGGAEVRYSDELWDPEAEQSSIKLPSDICIRKPGTDVVIVGSAVGPGGVSVTELDVFIRVGSVQKALRVTGPRVWYKGMTGLTLTDPVPFEGLPLMWEHAFGGFDDSSDKVVEEPRNPVGKGVAADASTLVHQPGPQIEDPADPIRSHKHRGAPAGVGAIGRHWEPRRSMTGTHDDFWMKERMPLPPLDQDERFHQAAAPGLIMTSHARGGELVELNNVSAKGAIRFELPKLSFFVGALIDRKMTEFRPALDTIVIRPSDDRTLELTWRSAVPLPRPIRRCSAIQVHERRRI
ncbi:MAG: DUF2169 domain-containing protein [Myxococcota bacterium]